jgi:hypothetical protein
MGFTRAIAVQLAVAQTYGTSKNMTAITNAAEAVATLEASHGVVAGDYLEMTSGWGRLNGRIVRAKTVATNDVTLDGINTTNTTLYPAGLGTGTVRKITPATGLINMSQVKLVNTSGGEMDFENMTCIDDVQGKEAPTIPGPTRLTLTVFDDPTLAWAAVLQAAADATTPLAFRLRYPNGVLQLFNAYVALQRFPQIEFGMALKTNITLALIAEQTRYAS